MVQCGSTITCLICMRLEEKSLTEHKQTEPFCGNRTALRAPDKVHIVISKTSISWPNPMFDHLVESSHRDDSNKWPNIGFGQETKELRSIEINFTHIIWSSASFSNKRSLIKSKTVSQQVRSERFFIHINFVWTYQMAHHIIDVEKIFPSLNSLVCSLNVLELSIFYDKHWSR